MPNQQIKDDELVWKVLDATQGKRIDWQKTAVEAQYAATFGGKWTLLIDKSIDPSHPDFFWLSMQNAEGEQILRIDADARLGQIFELARRHALKVNEALSDFLKELDSKK